MAKNRKRRTTDQLVSELRDFHHFEAADRLVHLEKELATFAGLDPLVPWTLNHPWHNWIEFIEQVALPMTEDIEDKEETERLMRLYRTVCPYFICTMMAMAYRRLDNDGKV